MFKVLYKSLVVTDESGNRFRVANSDSKLRLVIELWDDDNYRFYYQDQDQLKEFGLEEGSEKYLRLTWLFV